MKYHVYQSYDTMKWWIAEAVDYGKNVAGPFNTRADAEQELKKWN